MDAAPKWRSFGYPALAMAYHGLGKADEARRALATADKEMDDLTELTFRAPLGLVSFPWFESLECRLLYREATVLLTGSSPPEDPRLEQQRKVSLAALSDNGAAPFLARSHALAQQGKWAAAAVEMAQALERSGDFLAPNSNLNRACFEAVQSPELFAELVRLCPADAHLWVARGRSLARRKEWAQALAAYDRVMATRPPDDSAMLEYACLHLLIGNTAGYRRLCARLAERYGNDADLWTVHILSRACTLGEGAVADPAQPVAWAQRWTTRRPALAWTLHAVGAAQYRAARYEDAIRHLRESQALAPTWPGQSMNDAFLALAHGRLGQLQEAKRALERTDRWLADAERDFAAYATGFPPRVWPADWLIVQVLCGEANRLLAGPTTSSKNL
jgi:tetratricopeptide (TPR) repeat protein